MRHNKSLTIGSVVNCADNSGAKKLRIIGVIGLQGTKNRYLSCGVGNQIVCTVQKGPTSLTKKVHYGVIVRQKAPFFRAKGDLLGRVRFEQNAAVLLQKKAKGLVPRQNTIIKGPIAIQVKRNSMLKELKGDYK